MIDDKEEYEEFDALAFFHQLFEKLQRAKAQDLSPATKEEPWWMFSVPEEVEDGQIKSFFMMMARQEGDDLEIHYGNSESGDFYVVTFPGATKEHFVKCVQEIIDNVYGNGVHDPGE